ncbi:tail completion protein gp17 [Paenibacillus apiarius]|uniref:tail completion protein gp17 n=1 Tax=Paenibacillus apiarius TaxID=46240 RepID=UPI003B3A3FC3
MIIDIKTEIRTALLANQSLSAMLGKDKFGNVPIYQMIAAEAEKYPRITFFEVTNFDSAFAEDTAFGSEIIIQIDVWSKESTSAISGEVDRVMKGLSYTRTSAADLYEDDTKVLHKAMRFKTNRIIEE